LPKELGTVEGRRLVLNDRKKKESGWKRKRIASLEKGPLPV